MDPLRSASAEMADIHVSSARHRHRVSRGLAKYAMDNSGSPSTC
ncbi:MAG: hypothetical protein ACLUE1_03670 [Adlercreutzia equolifaciens]